MSLEIKSRVFDSGDFLCKKKNTKVLENKSQNGSTFFSQTFWFEDFFYRTFSGFFSENFCFENFLGG